MRTRIALPLFITGLLLSSLAAAQVKVGDNPQIIDPASVLELESTERVLVITRVDSLQMSAITPSRGALVYNTSADCVFYFNGTDWVNLCGSEGGVAGFFTDPVENDISTIVINSTPTGGNIEIAPNSITSDLIVNGGINGVDIQNGSIGPGKLQNNSVSQEKLSENSVGPFAIDNDNIDLDDFNNTTGFIRTDDIVSGQADNAITEGVDGGAFYDDSAVTANTAAIAAAGTADQDANPTNEIQVLGFDTASREITLSQGGGAIVLPAGASEVDGDIKNELITDVKLNPKNQLVITEGGVKTRVNLSRLAGGGAAGGDNQTIGPAELNEKTNILRITLENGGFTTVDLSPLVSGGPSTDEQNMLQATLSPDNILTIPIENGDETTVDLSSLAGTGTGGGGGGTGSTEPADGTTILGTGTDTNKFRIAPGTAGQFLSTNTDGEVAWAVPNGDGATLTEGTGISLVDNAINVNDLAGEISGPTSATVITDDAVTSAKIENATILAEDLANMGAVEGQILKWNQVQNTWQVADNEAVPKFDDKTINVNEKGELQVPDRGISTDQIETFSITEELIKPPEEEGFVLTSIIRPGEVMAVEWQAPRAGFGSSDAPLSENRTLSLAGNDFIFGGSGNVAIGTLKGAPQDKLDVDGQIRARNGFAATAGSANNPGYGFYTDGNTDMGMFRAGVDQIGFSTQGIEVMRVDENQRIGIGTVRPKEKLHVIGNILADEYITPDYVFQQYYEGESSLKPFYKLLPLSEIEAFTKLNKHLPGVPSAKEVKERGGILINKATEINLEKIEELYLHTIEQEKKIEQLQSEKEILSVEVKALRNDIGQIKAMLEKLN